MEIVVFQSESNFNESLSNFRDVLFGSQMRHLASDLFDEGLSPSSISLAVDKAISICIAAEIEVRQHFVRVYTEVDNMLIKDCKLSDLGMGLVLLNAGVHNPITAHWQFRVIRKFLES